MSNEASETYKDMFDPGWREREKKQHDTFRALFTLQPVTRRRSPPRATEQESAVRIDELKAKKLDAETRCGQWLADGNEAAEARKLEKAEKCYAKAQYWLDRANKLQDQIDARG